MLSLCKRVQKSASWVISAVLDEKIEAYVHPDIISPMVYCQPKPFDNPGIVEQETEKGYVAVCCIEAFSKREDIVRQNFFVKPLHKMNLTLLTFDIVDEEIHCVGYLKKISKRFVKHLKCEDVHSEMHTFEVIRDSAWQWYTRETFE